MPPKHRRFFRFIAVAAVSFLFTLFLLREPILQGIGDFLIIEDELHPADVIHVIAGADYRTDHAIQLYRQGLGKQILFTGGRCTCNNYYYGQHDRDLALEQGVPPEAIAIDDTTVTSTYSEVVRLKEFIARSPTPIHSVIVVSDPFHMRRSQWTYRKVLGEGIEILMAPVPFEQTPYQRRWWTDITSQRYVVDEYKKSLYYLLRYQFSQGWVQDWLASFDED